MSPEPSRTRPSLLQAAARSLEDGPLHTLDLAREVLGLEGHPGAASAAVFQLLGQDPRFLVDGDGVWALISSSEQVGPPFEAHRYAVVDVESTGSSHRRGHRIIELAIVEVEDGAVASSFQTLVNPGRRIPPGVRRLTGISDEMVSGAPYFESIAEEVLRRLEGRVFVAHNVRFDWKLVSRSLVDALGEAPDVRRLCTVRMARRLVRGLRRRNLDAVSAHYGVEVQDRHRAQGDALATARILLRLLDEARARGLRDLTALESFLAGSRPSRAPRSDPGQKSFL